MKRIFILTGLLLCNSRRAVEEYLCKLYEYIGKYQNQNIVELYKAYLDIAHINDNLWELLAYPDDYGKKFLSGDSKLDYRRVQKYKKEALFYYEKIVISGLFENDKIKKRIQKLKNNMKSNEYVIIWD